MDCHAKDISGAEIAADYIDSSVTSLALGISQLRL